VRLAEFEGAVLIELPAGDDRSCACPCEEACHQGACQGWVRSGQTYYLALIGPERRTRELPVCSGCVAALGKAGHLRGVTNHEALNVDRMVDSGGGSGVEPGLNGGGGTHE
jgi:hypothetical protein